MKKIVTTCLMLVCCCAFTISRAQKTVKVIGTATNGKYPISLKQGFNAKGASKVVYQQEGMPSLKINLKEPVVISVASKPEKWGFFQFPNFGFKPDGSIQAKWNMTRDAIEAYGENNFGTALSVDKGRTWKLQDSVHDIAMVVLPNGDRLDVITPKPIKVEDLKLPKPIGLGTENYRKTSTNYYRLSELPESRNGVYLKRLKKGETQWVTEKATLNDPDAARYSLSGLFPIVWWGDMKVARDGSLITGIYPGILIRKDGTTDPRGGVFFYRSTDNGKSWNVQGRIPFSVDSIGDPLSKKRMGFTEPAFEILKDGTYLCVVRTTDGAGNGPMFASYSKDEGKTWTTPVSITGNGVLPRLLQLENGVLVMSSGRPGVQLRFSTDKNGLVWTEPFEMLPYGDAVTKEQGWSAAVSDGYTGLLAIGKDKFLHIYTDFAYQTANGEFRKAIKVREITVNTN